MSIGLDFVKQVDKNWKDHVTYIDGKPYKEEDNIRELNKETTLNIYTVDKSIISKIEKVIDQNIE